ncbi:uncharacterized protein J3D65DRAFT_602319 [Phyllosticta citribraziliensis]|uniref:Uncharacterized protein n=1 Tax=Phyllosticta citribraziliensis TaxID=989973 RepID=A0ABR1LUW1_9PEZI
MTDECFLDVHRCSTCDSQVREAQCVVHVEESSAIVNAQLETFASAQSMVGVVRMRGPGFLRDRNRMNRVRHEYLHEFEKHAKEFLEDEAACYQTPARQMGRAYTHRWLEDITADAVFNMDMSGDLNSAAGDGATFDQAPGGACAWSDALTDSGDNFASGEAGEGPSSWINAPSGTLDRGFAEASGVPHDSGAAIEFSEEGQESDENDEGSRMAQLRWS